MRPKQEAPFKREFSGTLSAAITVSVNLVAAVLIGVAISTIYSVAKMSTSVLRREFSGSRLISKKVRQAQEALYLREHGEKIRILELQGPIFFGSTDRLAMLIENKTEEEVYCILDMKRINEIDTRGAKILVRLHRVLNRQNKHLLICHFSDNPTFWNFLEATGAAGAIPIENFFEDTNTALEWAEDQLLARFLSEENRRYYPIDETDLLLGSDPNELETFFVISLFLLLMNWYCSIYRTLRHGACLSSLSFVSPMMFVGSCRRFLRFPLDHIFHSDHFTLSSICRLASFGSDHFPLLTELVAPGSAKQLSGRPGRFIPG